MIIESICKILSKLSCIKPCLSNDVLDTYLFNCYLLSVYKCVFVIGTLFSLGLSQQGNHPFEQEYTYRIEIL